MASLLSPSRTLQEHTNHVKIPRLLNLYATGLWPQKNFLWGVNWGREQFWSGNLEKYSDHGSRPLFAFRYQSQILNGLSNA
jgi:hypothetical protein